MRLFLATFGLVLMTSQFVSAAGSCGSTFNEFVRDLKSEAQSRGHSKATVNRFFDGVRQDPKVLRADRGSLPRCSG